MTRNSELETILHVLIFMLTIKIDCLLKLPGLTVVHRSSAFTMMNRYDHQNVADQTLPIVAGLRTDRRATYGLSLGLRTE